MVAYTIVVLYLTLLDRTTDEKEAINLVPFWTYKNIGVSALRWQIYLNVLLFLPFGFLIPFSIQAGFLKTLGMAALLSAAIELCQFSFGLGLCEIDDLIHNSLGATLGFAYWRLLTKWKTRQNP